MSVESASPAGRRRSPLPATSTFPCDLDFAALVTAARAGDRNAWTSLVRQLDPMLRRVVRRYGLSPTQVDDAVQQTWMRLCESIGSLRQPAAVAGWLITTARREALRLLQSPVGELLSACSAPRAAPPSSQRSGDSPGVTES
jgi:DNA-directed RNA polymerase specialized sigma24 family protein